MRITIEITPLKRPVTLPNNNSHMITSLIYKILSKSSPEYSTWLHKEGYRLGKKVYKLFTFSPIYPGYGKKWSINPSGTISTEESMLRFTVSSPVRDFIKHFRCGLNHLQDLFIGHEQFIIRNHYDHDSPIFSDEMRFIMLSPVVCSTKYETQNYSQYLFPGDPVFNRVVFDNLLDKYNVLNRKSFACSIEDLQIELNSAYVEKKVNGNVDTLTTITKNDKNHFASQIKTEIKGTRAPFRIKAPAELIKIGYECGFGEKNSMGFGMVKVDTKSLTIAESL
jgi:CRISPR-associated endoribonuclease Cas6